MNYKFWEKKAVQTKSAVLGTSKELGDFLIFGTSGNAATPNSAMQLYDKSTAVSIPVNMVAEAFASIQPVIEINGKIVDKHPILDLLAAPSPFYTQDLFFEALGKNYLITGEAELVASGSVNSPPRELQPISPANVSIVEGSGGIVRNITVSGNSLAGDYAFVLAKKRVRYLNGSLLEIKHIRNYSTESNSLLRGTSPLKAASAEVRQHIQGNTHNVSLLENGGRVSLVFHFDEDLNTVEFEEVKARVISQYGGAQKAGSIGVTSGGKLSINEMGVSNKDMDFANLQQMSQRAVSLQYKVPLPLVTTDAATFNNYAEAKLALYDDAVIPLANRKFAGLTSLIVPSFGLDPSKVRITYDADKITAHEKRRNENLKLRKELQLETLNEMRAMIGREDVDSGNQVMQPSSMVPVGTDIFKEPNSIPDEDEIQVVRDRD